MKVVGLPVLELIGFRTYSPLELREYGLDSRAYNSWLLTLTIFEFSRAPVGFEPLESYGTSEVFFWKNALA